MLRSRLPCHPSNEGQRRRVFAKFAGRLPKKSGAGFGPDNLQVGRPQGQGSFERSSSSVSDRRARIRNICCSICSLRMFSDSSVIDRRGLVHVATGNGWLATKAGASPIVGLAKIIGLSSTPSRASAITVRGKKCLRKARLFEPVHYGAPVALFVWSARSDHAADRRNVLACTCRRALPQQAGLRMLLGPAWVGP